MRVKKPNKQAISRRQFIRFGAAATAGLLLAACGGNPPAEEAAPAAVR
jgi:hypothetical protein